jgi:ferritin-like metal-binding protein YciE
LNLDEHASVDPEDLKNVYIDALKDLCSANNQMLNVIKKITSNASDPKLKEMLGNSDQGIIKHTAVLKELTGGQDGKISKEHCKAMEGQVAEETKHVLEESPKKGQVLDAIIIAQYQRMTNYGIAGFYTAAAHAEALGLNDDSISKPGHLSSWSGWASLPRRMCRLLLR